MAVEGGVTFCNGKNLTVGGGGGRSCMVDEGGSQVVTPPTMDVLLGTTTLGLEVGCLTSAILCSLGGAGRGGLVTPEGLFSALIGVRGGGGGVALGSFVGATGGGLVFSNRQFCNKQYNM